MLGNCSLVLLLVAASSCSNDSRQEPDKPRPADVKPADVKPAEPKPADPQPAQAVLLELSYTRGENSKDSHSNRFTCKIEGKQMTYSGPYGECERGQCSAKQITLTLTAADIDGLAAAIGKADLPATFREVKPVDAIGSYVRLSLAVAVGDRKAALTIYGMFSIWRGGKRGKELSEAARTLLSSIDELRRQLRDLARRELPDAH